MRSGPAVGQAATVRLLLADSASLYWRAFHALPDTITAPDGTPVNAVRGFLDTLGRIAQARGSDRLVACWDDDWRPAWRVELVPSYKAHRVADDAVDVQVAGRDAPHGRQTVGAASTTKHAVVAVDPPMLSVATRSAPST